MLIHERSMLILSIMLIRPCFFDVMFADDLCVLCAV
jgi:hypothetical protein